MDSAGGWETGCNKYTGGVNIQSLLKGNSLKDHDERPSSDASSSLPMLCSTKLVWRRKAVNADHDQTVATLGVVAQGSKSRQTPIRCLMLVCSHGI